MCDLYTNHLCTAVDGILLNVEQAVQVNFNGKILYEPEQPEATPIKGKSHCKWSSDSAYL